MQALPGGVRRKLVEEEKKKAGIEEISLLSDNEAPAPRRSSRKSTAARKLKDEEEDMDGDVDMGAVDMEIADGPEEMKASGSGTGKAKGIDRDSVMEVLLPRPRYVTTAVGAEFGKFPFRDEMRQRSPFQVGSDLKALLDKVALLQESLDKQNTILGEHGEMLKAQGAELKRMAHTHHSTSPAPASPASPASFSPLANPRALDMDVDDAPLPAAFAPAPAASTSVRDDVTTPTGVKAVAAASADAARAAGAAHAAPSGGAASATGSPGVSDKTESQPAIGASATLSPATTRDATSGAAPERLSARTSTPVPEVSASLEKVPSPQPTTMEQGPKAPSPAREVQDEVPASAVLESTSKEVNSPGEPGLTPAATALGASVDAGANAPTEREELVPTSASATTASTAPGPQAAQSGTSGTGGTGGVSGISGISAESPSPPVPTTPIPAPPTTASSSASAPPTDTPQRAPTLSPSHLDSSPRHPETAEDIAKRGVPPPNFNPETDEATMALLAAAESAKTKSIAPLAPVSDGEDEEDEEHLRQDKGKDKATTPGVEEDTEMAEEDDEDEDAEGEAETLQPLSPLTSPAPEENQDARKLRTRKPKPTGIKRTSAPPAKKETAAAAKKRKREEEDETAVAAKKVKAPKDQKAKAVKKK